MSTTKSRLGRSSTLGLILLLLVGVWTTMWVAHVLLNAPMAMAWVMAGVVAFMNVCLYLPRHERAARPAPFS